MSEKPSVDSILQDASEATGDMSHIDSLCVALKKAHEEKEEIEEQLSLIKDKVKILEEEVIPQAMKAANVNEVKTDDYTLKITEYNIGNIPSASAIEKEKDPEEKQLLIDRREKAFQYLTEQGNSSLIKNKVVVKFEKEQDELAEQLKADLLSKGHAVDVDKSVHPATLNSHIKECLTKGLEIDLDIFKVKTFTKAAIKAVKK